MVDKVNYSHNFNIFRWLFKDLGDTDLQIWDKSIFITT